MSLNNVRFVLGKGGIGRPLPGEDYISGLLFYSGSLPSGFSSSNRIKQFFSVGDAEAAGILDDYSDSTAATGSYQVTNKGTDGETVTLSVADIDSSGNAQTVELAAYTKVVGDSTTALVAAAITALINAGTLTHGYSASLGSSTVTITAPKRLGVYLNSGTPLTATYSDTPTLAGTLTQFSGGTGSKLAVMHYHIKEYFRIQPQGNLYVGIFAVPSPYTFTEITTMQNYAAGKIRQIGVYKELSAFSGGDLTTIHNVCAANVAAHKEIIALYAGDISGTSDVSTLANLALLSANYCSAVIGQDGGGLGHYLYLVYGKSITTLGATLGATALAKVSESIAWVAKFNISDGSECDSIAFANGKAFTDSSVTDSLLTQLQNYAYIFLRKFVGVPGSFFNENRTAIAASSDYAYISDNRTIQKATRVIYASLVQDLNSPITLNSDGTLSDEAIAYFSGKAATPLNQMIRDGELSGQAVAIDATQNILQTGILTISVSLVQIATGRNIVVNIGYKVAV